MREELVNSKVGNIKIATIGYGNLVLVARD